MLNAKQTPGKISTASSMYEMMLCFFHHNVCSANRAEPPTVQNCLEDIANNDLDGIEKIFKENVCYSAPLWGGNCALFVYSLKRYFWSY